MPNENEPSLTLLGGGDVGPMAQPVDRLADLVQPVLESVDFRFGQCERTYSDKPASTFPRWDTTPAGVWSRITPDHAEIFRTAKIDVVSMASNHALDWGYEPFIETLDLFDGWGIQVIGGGRNEEEARKPAILEKDGVKIAMLGYCSQTRDGQSASGDVPGMATLRARTTYERVDFQPGTPPKIHTFPFEHDLEAACDDVRAIKDDVDGVVVSIHWGITHLPKTIADYQEPMAHALIDAGVDVIIGHGPHALKAVEQYNGGICFYSVGCFLTTGNLLYRDRPPHARWDLFWHKPPPKDSLYQFPEDSKMAVLPKLTFTKAGLTSAKMVPVFINDLAQPEPLTRDDPRFQELLDHFEWVSDQYPHTFGVDGDDLTVELEAAS